MSDNWLEIRDERIDATEIMGQVRERMASRGGASSGVGDKSPVAVSEALWQEMIGDAAGGSSFGNHLPAKLRDCDIVPRQYVIDWRIPILGPIHAFVRRFINAEIRRYLLSSLEKQSHLNRQMLRILAELGEENRRLRQEIVKLQGTGMKER